VVAIGHSEYGECAVNYWTDITQIAAANYNTVGRRADGTAVATGQNHYGQCNVGSWTDIVQVVAGGSHTVGLEADGTVVRVGNDAGGQSAINDWTDITQVAAGEYHAVGLKADGSVVAAGPEIELAKWDLGVVQYTLTISDTSGGSIDTPGDGVFTYNAGTLVHLVVKPQANHRFVRWTGDVGSIADVKAATTVITMHDNYAVTANFALNWPLIGGVTGAVVVAAGLVVFFVRRSRGARTERQRRKKARKKKR
jgi:alpha-tubulin suppressor-like RCC1 family protein